MGNDDEVDEVLASVRFPVWNSRSGFAVHEFPRLHGDFAIADTLVAMQLDEQDRVVRRVIGLLGLGSTPRRATAAEESIIGNPVNELVAGDIGQAAMTGLDDIPTDLQRSASVDPSRPGSSRGQAMHE